MVEVAVIGAGAAGLVATRHLLKAGLRASLFDSRLATGGAWTSAQSSVVATRQQQQHQQQQERPQMWDNLTPNLSKFTCCFSEMLWPDDTPTFPTLENMHQYLDNYATRFVTPFARDDDDDSSNNAYGDTGEISNASSLCSLQLGCTVTSVTRQTKSTDTVPTTILGDNSSSSSSSKDEAVYLVEWNDRQGASFSKNFNAVVVATGFFSTPIWPSSLLPFRQIKDNNCSSSISSTSYHRVIHSSQYRSPSEFTNPTAAVAVIGGSFSAHEIASDIRRHHAAAQTMSGSRRRDVLQSQRHGRVVNVAGEEQRIPYILPRNVPVLSSPSPLFSSGTNIRKNCNEKNRAGGFLPMDCVLYRREQDAPLAAAAAAAETIAMTEETCRKKHNLLQGWIGSRKLRQASAAGLPMGRVSSSLLQPPMVSISEDFLDFVIDQKIEVVPGKLNRATWMPTTDANPNGAFQLELDNGAVVSGIDQIIACTGYQSRLDFLAPEILDILQYDESDSFAPFLACYDTVHPLLPGLGFVGMYKGPYFGVMELQARLLAALWSGRKSELSQKTISKTMAASLSIRQGRPRAQFPHFDYIGMMDSLALEVDALPNDEFRSAGNMVSPLFYQPDNAIAKACQSNLVDMVSEQCDNIPRATLSALLGSWSFERSICDRLTATSQRVHGNVSFSLQETNLDCLLYREDGFLDLPNGNQLEVFREYVYLQQGGALNIHFVENGSQAGLFLDLKFYEKSHGSWKATSEHLCINDLYKGTFQITFEGLSATEVVMTYRVNGPNKDYEAVTYLRPTD